MTHIKLYYVKPPACPRTGGATSGASSQLYAWGNLNRIHTHITFIGICRFYWLGNILWLGKYQFDNGACCCDRTRVAGFLIHRAHTRQLPSQWAAMRNTLHCFPPLPFLNRFFYLISGTNGLTIVSTTRNKISVIRNKSYIYIYLWGFYYNMNLSKSTKHGTDFKWSI